jgi:hypothetical protein
MPLRDGTKVMTAAPSIICYDSEVCLPRLVCQDACVSAIRAFSVAGISLFS